MSSALAWAAAAVAVTAVISKGPPSASIFHGGSDGGRSRAL